ALIRLAPDGRKLQFSGANRPLLLVRAGQETEIQPDKMPIGHPNLMDLANDRRFAVQEVELQPGDRFYMFSDGIHDQFSTEGKRFSKKRLKDTLVDLGRHSVTKQGELL